VGSPCPHFTPGVFYPRFPPDAHQEREVVEAIFNIDCTQFIYTTEAASFLGLFSVSLGDADYGIVLTDAEAAYSFVLGLFVATIFFASRAVEVAIDMDDRMTGEKETSRWKWLTLSPRFE